MYLCFLSPNYWPTIKDTLRIVFVIVLIHKTTSWEKRHSSVCHHIKPDMWNRKYDQNALIYHKTKLYKLNS